MSDRHIGPTPMQPPRPEYFPPPHRRAPEPVMYPAPGMLERVPRPFPVGRPSEPDDAGHDRDDDDHDDV